MHKNIVKKLMLTLTILCVVTVIPIAAQISQTVSVNNSVKIQAAPNGENRTTAPDCQADLETANKRLEKMLDALEKAEAVISALNAEIKTRKYLQTTSDQLLLKKDEIIADQTKLIREYEKQKQKRISFLWGAISIRF